MALQHGRRKGFLLRTSALLSLGWLAFTIVLGFLGVAMAGVALAFASTQSTSSAVSLAHQIGRMQPVGKFIGSVPVISTLETCAASGRWWLPTSLPCSFALLGASSASLGSDLAANFDHYSRGEVLSNGRFDLGQLREFQGDVARIDGRIHVFNQGLEPWMNSPVVPSVVQERVKETYARLWQVDSGLLAASQLAAHIESQKPLRYLVALTSQAETRAGGGLLGLFGVISIDQGKLALESLGSNLQLPRPAQVPEGLDPGFYALFGRGNPEWQNLNLSPDGPTSGQAFTQAWRSVLGQRLDGVLAIDTVALGQLCHAAGITIRESSGRTLSTADEITDYASFGVYQEFAGEDLARKEYQVEIFSAVVGQLLSSPNVIDVASSLVGALRADHGWVYSSDPLLERMFISARVAASMEQVDKREMKVRFNNLSGNKSDFFLRSKLIQGPQKNQVTLRVSLDPKLAQVSSPIVRNRLDQFRSSGLGSYLQILLVTGDDLSVTDISSSTSLQGQREVDLAGKRVRAVQTNVTLSQPVIITLTFAGALPDLENALAGALIHP